MLRRKPIFGYTRCNKEQEPFFKKFFMIYLCYNGTTRYLGNPLHNEDEVQQTVHWLNSVNDWEHGDD